MTFSKIYLYIKIYKSKKNIEYVQLDIKNSLVNPPLENFLDDYLDVSNHVFFLSVLKLNSDKTVYFESFFDHYWQCIEKREWFSFPGLSLVF